ncbi:MAG: tetratricopeptide repeat protein [Thiogranum sp.]|nr:tetratricopeptide repeat protein [Thiogranum sp.]
MIGFECKSAGLRTAAVMLASLVVAGCAHPLFQPGREEPEVTPEAAPIEAIVEEAMQLPPAPEPAPGDLSAELLFDILLGEIAGQRGVLDISGASYLEAARQSDDPRVAERALKISVFGKQQDLALQAARRWVALAPDNLEARHALGALALRTGNAEEALEQFEYLLEHREDNDSDPYQSMLALLAREPDQQRALEVMQRLVEAHPEEPEICYAYARLAVHVEDWPLADRQIATCLTLRPDWTPALVLQAQIALKTDAAELARQRLESALQRKPKDAELRLAYARMLVELEQYPAAREQYRILLKQQPDSGQIVYSLALLALEAGQLDEAKSQFEKLLELDYQPQQAYYYLGAIAEDAKDYERALQWYRKVTEGDHWLEVQIRSARIEAESGDVDTARERLRQLRLAQPTQAQRLYLVEGDILSHIDWHEEAYALYTRYLESQPDDIEILYARALVSEKLDRLDQAETDFRRILEIDPGNARALNALGYTLADRTDRYDEAYAYIEQALALEPDDPAVIDSMGWVLYRMGRLQEARDYLQKAYELNPDVEIAAHLGEVMWKMGDRDAARELWNKARKASPGNKVMEETVRRFAP